MNRIKNIKTILFLIFSLSTINWNCYSQDPNYYIFLSFGQSNMEGHGNFDPQDTLVNPRFRVLQAVDCDHLNRKKENWYGAVPPLSRCNTGLTPADYFGRTMVSNLPDSIRIGIINVSVGGCKIELFGKDTHESYASTAPDWMKNIIESYGGNPYGRLVELAQMAQKDGVIKGILLHQGESNTGDQGWPEKVNHVYGNLLGDLGLQRDRVPLLVGELVSAEQGGKCASMNSIIAELPAKVTNAHVISSQDCEAVSDGLHFSAAGYRKLGTRYGEKMLSLMGISSGTISSIR